MVHHSTCLYHSHDINPAIYLGVSCSWQISLYEVFGSKAIFRLRSANLFLSHLIRFQRILIQGYENFSPCLALWVSCIFRPARFSPFLWALMFSHLFSQTGICFWLKEYRLFAYSDFLVALFLKCLFQPAPMEKRLDMRLWGVESPTGTTVSSFGSHSPISNWNLLQRHTPVCFSHLEPGTNFFQGNTIWSAYVYRSV